MNYVKSMVLLFVVIGIIPLPAETSVPAGDAKTGFSIGGATVLESQKSGGFLEFGFPILRSGATGGLEIRNYISLNGWGLGAGGAATVTDKLTFGGFLFPLIRSYAFIEGGLGLYGNSSKLMTAMPLIWDFKGGGGVNFYLTPSSSFFAEMGGGVSGYSDMVSQPTGMTGFAAMRMGFRNFF